MHHSSLLSHHLALSLDILDFLILIICTVDIPQRPIHILLTSRGIVLSLTPQTTRNAHVRIHEERIRPRSQFTVIRFENPRHDTLD